MENSIKNELLRLGGIYLSDASKKCWLDSGEFERNSPLSARRNVAVVKIFNLAFFEFGDTGDFEAFEGYFFENAVQMINGVSCNADIVQVREFDKAGMVTRIYKIRFEYIVLG